jgi:hypothetical protein
MVIFLFKVFIFFLIVICVLSEVHGLKTSNTVFGTSWLLHIRNYFSGIDSWRLSLSQILREKSATRTSEFKGVNCHIWLGNCRRDLVTSNPASSCQHLLQEKPEATVPMPMWHVHRGHFSTSFITWDSVYAPVLQSFPLFKGFIFSAVLDSQSNCQKGTELSPSPLSPRNLPHHRHSQSSTLPLMNLTDTSHSKSHSLH